MNVSAASAASALLAPKNGDLDVSDPDVVPDDRKRAVLTNLMSDEVWMKYR